MVEIVAEVVVGSIPHDWKNYLDTNIVQSTSDIVLVAETGIELEFAGPVAAVPTVLAVDRAMFDCK